MALTTIPSELSSVSGIADSSDATAITIDSSENVTFAGNILKTGDLTVDVSGVINLDAGTQVILKDDGTNYGTFYQTSSDFYIQSLVQDKDIVLYGNDGGSGIIALRLDMSEAGAATFNKGVTFGDDLTMPSGSNVTWGTSYPALGNILNSQATILGNNIKAGATNNTIVRHANGTDAANFIALTYNKGVTFHTGITTTQNSDVAETTNERVRIDTTGKVGIGTNAPTHMLHVVDGNNYAVLGDTQSNSTMSLRMADTAAYPVEVQAYGNDLRINTASSANATPTVKMLVQYTGYVGIGTTSPGSALHISGGNNLTSQIRFTNTAPTPDNDWTIGSYYNDQGLYFRSNDNATNVMVMLDTGQVGIGTTTPSAKLNVVSTSSATYSGSSAGSNIALQLTNSESGAAGRTIGIAFSSESNAEVYLNCVTAANNNGGDFVIASRNGGTRAEKLRIEASGAVLPGGDATQNLGSASKRWDNLYVNDMHFSNEGSDGNDVDGTTGDWTLQEGEEHLYIINNKSGKKFKFSLEEVD